MALEDNVFLTTVMFVGGCLLFLIGLTDPFNNFVFSSILVTIGFAFIIPGILKVFKLIDDRLYSRDVRK